jgi:uncharacterized DUF497 family protein
MTAVRAYRICHPEEVGSSYIAPEYRYTIRITVRFEWDVEKDRINRKKHAGVGFENAALIFDDPNLLLRKDRAIEGEQRWHAIGAIRGAVLLVVHVYRKEKDSGDEVIRIISARKAGKRERRVYSQQASE